MGIRPVTRDGTVVVKRTLSAVVKGSALTPSSEVYVSTDVETDGPLPGVNSMLSLGSVAFSGEGEVLDTFSANLEPLPRGVTDARTMAFWAGEPLAWAAATASPRPPAQVMTDYLQWLSGLDGSPIFVGLPAVYDFGFVNHYLLRFCHENPFRRNAIDIRSYAMAILGTSWQGTTLADMPDEWVRGWEHDHTAAGDAMVQGRLFMRMRSVVTPAHGRDA